MRADNSHHLAAAARRRSEDARRRAAAALRRLDTTGTPITVGAVAREAGVSRSWLYTQPDLHAEIDRLRQATSPGRRAVPDRQRASDNSLRQRLELATARIRQLEADNTRLRRALGDNRASPTRDTRTRHASRNAPPRSQASSPTPSTTQTRSSQH